MKRGPNRARASRLWRSDAFPPPHFWFLRVDREGGGRQEQQRSTGVQQPGWIATCFFFFFFSVECHRSSRGACVSLHEAAGWRSLPATVSPPPDAWSPLDLRPTEDDIVWIWNGACRWAKFSASEKHRNHGQSSAVSVCVCVCVCVDVSQWLLDWWCRIDRDSGQPVWQLADRGGSLTDTRGLAPSLSAAAAAAAAANTLEGVCVCVCLLCYHATVCWCAVFNVHPKKGGVCVILAMCVWVCVCDRKQGPRDFSSLSLFFFFEQHAYVRVRCFIMKGWGCVCVCVCVCVCISFSALWNYISSTLPFRDER